MKTRELRIPPYRRHKARNLAVVTVNGKDHYLGKYGSPESREAYAKLIGEYVASGGVGRVGPKPDDKSAPPTTVSEVVLAFMRHAEDYYRRADGTDTGETDNFRHAVRPLLKLYGRSPAKEFGPMALKVVRQAMLDGEQLCRNVINYRIRKIVHVFAWAVSNELIPASVHHGLRTVAALGKGRSKARETEPVKPVPESHVEAVLPFVSRQVAAMMQLQALTGMRPNEVISMRNIDLDVSGPVWIYRPHRHKTEHHGKERLIGIGPKAQEVLRPWLRTELEANLFQPAEAREEWEAEQRAKRQPKRSPTAPGKAKTKKKRNPKRRPRQFYETKTYAYAVHKGCVRAGVPPFRPNRLRHLAATRIRKAMGLEAAKAVLGHSGVETTEIYAEQDRNLAADVMAKLG